MGQKYNLPCGAEIEIVANFSDVTHVGITIGSTPTGLIRPGIYVPEIHRNVPLVRLAFTRTAIPVLRKVLDEIERSIV